MKKISSLTVFLALIDLFFLFLFWLARPDLLGRFLIFLALFSAGLLGLAAYWQKRQEAALALALQRLILAPDAANQAALLQLASKRLRPALTALADHLEDQTRQQAAGELALERYQDFLEGWVHEIKTPLALLELVLANNQPVIPPAVWDKLDYVKQLSLELVDKIMYYARLEADHVDLVFLRLSLEDLIQQKVTDLAALAAVRGLTVQLELEPVFVVSDQKLLSFILGQLLGNAIKYAASPDGLVQIETGRLDGPEAAVFLAIRNNGQKVLAQDRPFLFDKGFVGNQPQRQKATGMGLYLASQAADRLALQLVLAEETDFSFAIKLLFPAHY